MPPHFDIVVLDHADEIEPMVKVAVDRAFAAVYAAGITSDLAFRLPTCVTAKLKELAEPVVIDYVGKSAQHQGYCVASFEWSEEQAVIPPDPTPHTVFMAVFELTLVKSFSAKQRRLPEGYISAATH